MLVLIKVSSNSLSKFYSLFSSTVFSSPLSGRVSLINLSGSIKVTWANPFWGQFCEDYQLVPFTKDDFGNLKFLLVSFLRFYIIL